MKRIFLTTFLAVACVGAASAQISGINPGVGTAFEASDQIEVLTTVLEPLTVTAGDNLDFGFVQTGSAVYDEIQEGTFTINGNAGASVSLSQGLATDLDLSGDGSVEVTSVTLTAADTDGSGDAKLVGGSTTITVTGTLTLDGASAGEYSGVYELDVEYLSI